MADRFGVDPYVVRYVWPLDMFERAVQLMSAEADRADKRREAAREESKMGYLWSTIEGGAA